MERRPQGLKRVCGNPGEEPQVPPLRSPGFPVESLDQLHAALSTESCTRGRCWPREVGNPGGAPVGVCDFIDFSRSWKHLSFLFSPSVFFENE